MIAATSSTSAIHDIHCLPLPCFPPSPSLNGNSRRLSTPPCAASTMPLRIITVRTPASLAGWVSASHALQMPGEEVVAERAVFGDGIVAHAVDTDGRSRHEHGGLALAARDRRGDDRGAADTAVADARLLFVGPAALADAFTREVHDCVETFQRGRVDEARIRIPADVVAFGHAAAPQAQHPMPVAPQLGAERATDQPTRPTDHDIHTRARYDTRPSRAPLAQLVRASDS